MANKRIKIWIDLDNAPHVPFFAPIIDELQKRGYNVVVTARDRFRVSELATMHHIPHELIGGNHGKLKLVKGLGVVYRAFKLGPFAQREKPDLAISHGSRSQIIFTRMAGIPSVVLFDYEHASRIPFIDYDNFIIPEVIPAEVIKVKHRYIGKYPGIKEDVYVPRFRPTEGVLDEFGIDADRIVVLIRPPATDAHYQSPKSAALFRVVMDYVSADPETAIILLPRNEQQETMVRETWPDLIGAGKLVIPEKAMEGLNLMWHSDLVISGGGTMNREAAALGVPVYSIFRGETCYVDRYLTESGRLIMVESPQEVACKIRLEKWQRPEEPMKSSNRTLQVIVDELEAIAAAACPASAGRLESAQ